MTVKRGLWLQMAIVIQGGLWPAGGAPVKRITCACHRQTTHPTDPRFAAPAAAAM